MRRPLFERYSAWLFDLLAKYDEQKDVSGYSPQAQRVDGYLAERLFGVYLTRLRAEGTAVGFVPRLHFAGMESRGAYLKQRAETLLLPPGSVRRLKWYTRPVCTGRNRAYFGLAFSSCSIEV